MFIWVRTEENLMSDLEETITQTKSYEGILGT